MSDKWERKYIHVYWIESSTSGKTEIYRIESKLNNVELGIIKWYPNWRKYTFFPSSNTLYDSNCLDEISQFMKNLMIRRKDRNGHDFSI